jgi:predicted MPP superfamily phosphohydrolase
MRTRIAVFLTVFQSILLVGHWFVYHTWIHFAETPDPPGISYAQVALALLSMSFIAASLLAWRYSNVFVRLLYTVAATWLGVFSFCFWAACACWIAYIVTNLTGAHVDPQLFAVIFFGAALGASAYGVVNAAWTRVNRIKVRLPNLPESWRGRVAALVSDTHLGHVRNYGFARRIVRKISKLRPDVVFIAGDMYDGTAADVVRLAEPWRSLAAPLGAYFVAGNHEQFRGSSKYLSAVAGAGVRVLNNEKVTVDGMQIVGVHYLDSTDADHFRSKLRGVHLDPDRASILLSHAPHHLDVAEGEGISLQLSGHTHRGHMGSAHARGNRA